MVSRVMISKTIRSKTKRSKTIRSKTIRRKTKIKKNVTIKYKGKSIRGGSKNNKKGSKKKLVIVEKIEESEVPGKDIKINEEKVEKMSKRLNETFIDLMDKLSSIMMKQGEPFRARAYQKAQETMMTIAEDITTPEQLKGFPGIGPTIMEKLNEYISTGTLRILEREKNNPINILGEIYGVGPKKAKDLVDAGVTSVSQLRGKQDLLNDIQRVGLKYYEDILARVPRAEIDQYKAKFSEAFNKVKVPDSHFEIVGSYRRGAAESGDIDVIITSSDPKMFKAFVEELKKMGIILPDGILSFGPSKALVITKLEGAPFARRVDFLYTNQEEYPFAILYFTGSKIFNTVMRGRALSLGYSLNEHGMYKMDGKKKGEKVADAFKSEKDIFYFLGMEFKDPRDRVNGLSVVLASTVADVAPIPIVQIDPVSVEKKKQGSLKKGKKLIVVEKPKLKIVTKEEILQDKLDDAIVELVDAFKKHGIVALHAMNEEQLISILKEADKAFHLNKTPIMSDNEYDIVKDYAEGKYALNPYFAEVGTVVEKNKVSLPYTMASMDKIKPDTGALASWKTKFGGPYVLSCKLDGVSGMYSTEEDSFKLYTRGNGKVGQDVSHLIPYLHLPKKKGIVVRGEFIMPKEVFETKYKTSFANPRNLVAGVINRIGVDKEKIGDIHFVAYEVIQPVLKPSEQLQMLKEAGFETVLYKEVGDLTNELLSETLVDWRKNYAYEIDGVIVTDDKVYARKVSGNPDHAFAFKMVLSDQIAEAKVVNVLWTPSKDGYLKPRVQIEPIQLGGVTIEYATGFNADFIQKNKIGVGALIQIIRSGDVIPYIRGVTVEATEPMMPIVPYIWNDTHVDIMLEDAGSDATVREKNITGFFRGIGVDGLSSGNVARIIAAGFDSVHAILKMSVSDFKTVEGFKDKLATKIHSGIQEKILGASLVTLMSASNLFGRGFSDKKLELILEEYPDVLTSSDTDATKIAKVAAIKGMASKTAEAFVKNIPSFNAFLAECDYGLQNKIASSKIENAVMDTSHELYKKSVVLTGTRDKTLMSALKSVGASLGSSVSKNTFAVVAPSLDEDTGKAEDARRLGVPLYTPATFMAKYFV
jgi:NAD-dependent DNA ligase/DNA polymerase/3'-5' exonuclease PolX